VEKLERRRKPAIKKIHEIGVKGVEYSPLKHALARTVCLIRVETDGSDLVLITRRLPIDYNLWNLFIQLH